MKHCINKACEPPIVMAGFVIADCGDDWPGRVWVTCPSGEGGTFDRAAVMAAVELGPPALERYFWEQF